MLALNWLSDGRSAGSAKYTTRWDDNKGRLGAYLTGWTNWAKHGRVNRDKIHWQTMGAARASCFGSQEIAANVPDLVRCYMYHLDLIEFVKSERCAQDDWNQEQREQAIRLSRDEIERRGGQFG